MKLKKIILLSIVFIMLAVANIYASVENVSNITFDSDFYSNSYYDLKEAFGTDANELRTHFATYGIKEGRKASVIFDVKYYVQINNDLGSAFGTNYEEAYKHFLMYGINEGRNTSPVFDVKYYLQSNDDLEEAFGRNYEEAYKHFLKYGINEGRNTSPNFDVKYYLTTNNDLKDAFGERGFADAYKHFLTYGINEDRIVVENEPSEHIHNWNTEYTIDKVATCTEAGSKSIHCSDCDEVKNVTEIPMMDHTYNNDYQLVDVASKENTKEIVYECDVCHNKSAIKNLEISSSKTETLDLGGNTLEVDYITVKGTLNLSNAIIQGHISVDGGTLNLNNTEITSDDSTIQVKNSGVATITGGKVKSTVGSAVNVFENSTLTVNGVTIESQQMSIAGNATMPWREVIVKNSNLTGIAEPAIFMPGSSKKDANLTPKLTVSDSTLTGLSGIDARSGEIEITNSTITATGTDSHWNYVRTHDTATGTTDGASALYLHSQSPYTGTSTFKVTLTDVTLVNKNCVEHKNHTIRIYEHNSSGISPIEIVSDKDITQNIANELKGEVIVKLTINGGTPTEITAINK